MKKYILLFIMCIASIGAFAQYGSAVKLPLAVGDTIVNTGTVTKIIRTTAGYSGSALQVVLQKISGTGAGTVTILGSNDGVNYVAIGSAYTITNVTTQSQLFYPTAPLPSYLKVLAAGSGTESVQLSVWYTLRRYNTQ